jgi:hypothetical protein
MKYLKAFPDYDSTLPQLDGFVDSSWRHDTCPSLLNETLGFQLWCEYADENNRECGGKRFALYHYDKDDGILFLMESDSIEEIKQAIQAEVAA